MAILSKACKPDKFESHNSLKLSFTNVQGLHLNFVDSESFLNETFLTFLLCVRQNWMTQLIMAIPGYFPLKRKDSSTQMHGLAVYVKEVLPFVRDLCLENSADSYLCF